ncbi:MAG: 2-hydroxyacyl-CoA dehydratase family protein, partial [Chloroflexota bacterium]|nr:2-hydroxyacyl-CoA dehydratase family protein [Chloroflexota bacterium]
MTEEKKKKSINRLKTMYPLRALVDGMYEKALEASAEGKPVAWCMVNWWGGDVVLRAMDVACIYPEDYGAVCAASGVAPAYLARTDSDGFPTHMCGYARNCLGYAATMKDLGAIPPGAPMGGMAKPTLLLSSGYFCDTRYKWFQALGRYLDAPQWVLEMPHPGVNESRAKGARDHNIRFLVNELKEFTAFLEGLLKKKMDWDRLEELVDNTIEMNRVWYEVNELRKARPCPMHSRDFWSSMPASLYMAANPKETAALYRQMYDEVKSMVDNRTGAIAEEKYRLAFAELPPWHSLGFFNQLADRGWNFVVESWAYHPPKPIDLSKVSDPLERIAGLTYQYFSGYFEDAFNTGDCWGYFAHPYLEMAREYQCDGIVLHPLLTCRTATTHLMIVRDQLMKQLKIPSLVIEGDIVDLKLFDPADALKKAETFEETMEHYK